MSFKKIFPIVVMGSGLVLLNACSAPGNGSHNQNGNMENYGPGSSAQASGIGENDEFADENNGNGSIAQRIYYFDFDSSAVNDDYKPSLSAQADYLMANSHAKIIVEGHTDPRGSREYNIALGERRANAIADVLKSKGVSSSQIRVVSYGAERLAATGRTEEDYQKDRRAVIVKLQG